MKGLPRSLAHANIGVSKNIPVRNLAIRTTGATGVGFGTAVIRDLPEGNLLLLGAVAYLQFTKLDAGTLATFDGDFAIGSTATADATLDGTDVNIIPSTPLGAATGGVSPMVRGAQPAQTILDNTDGSLELNLNLLIDDASVSADDQDFTVSGVVTLALIVLGDD